MTIEEGRSPAMNSENPDPSQETPDDEPRVREPVYAKGPALSVPAEAVQLTLLDPQTLRAYAAENGTTDGEPEETREESEG
jgi:hypothetical protein